MTFGRRFMAWLGIICGVAGVVVGLLIAWEANRFATHATARAEGTVIGTATFRRVEISPYGEVIEISRAQGAVKFVDGTGRSIVFEASGDYEDGDSVTVAYDPTDPAYAKVEHSPKAAYITGAITASAGLMLALASTTALPVKRKRRGSSREQPRPWEIDPDAYP